MAKYGPGGADKKKDSSIFGSLKRAGGSALGATLNVLDKPGQAVRSGLAAASKTAYEGGNPLEDLRSLGAAAARGLVGKDHTSVDEVVSAALTGDKEGKVTKLPFGVNTAIGIALDPTSYLSLGATKAAEQGLQVTAREVGENVAKDIATQGIKKAVPAGAHRDALRQVLTNVAMRDGGLTAEKAAKAADRQMAAMARSGRGGLKVAGRSVPGLTAESKVGRAAAKVSPKRVVGDALRSTPAGVKVRSAFVRGAEVESTHGKETADALVRLVSDAGDRTTLRNAATEAAAKNVAKGANLTDERIAESLRALDIDPATQAARKEADDTFRVAKKADADALKAEARHADVARFADETLTTKRQVVEEAKAAAENAAAHIDGTVEARTALTAARKALRVAQTDLERTAEKLATSPSRQGIEQMAGVLRTQADHAVEAAKTARASIPENTKSAIARLRAEGDDGLADLVEFADKQRRRITDEQVGAGLLVNGAHDVGEYVPRYFTKAGLKAVDQHITKMADALSTPGRKVVSSELKHAVHQGEAGLRKIRPDLGIDDLNKMMVEKGWLKAGVKGVEDNPLAAITHRAHSADAAVEHVNLIKRVAEMTGPDGEPLLKAIEPNATPSNGKAALDLVEDAGVRYEGDPSIVKLLNEAKAVTTNDESLKAFQKWSTQATRSWRSMATFGPAFHARNEAGNIWLNYLAGVRNPAHYIRAGRLQKAAHEAFQSLGVNPDLDAAILALKVSDSDKAIIKAALDEGVLTKGFFQEDLVRTPVQLGGSRTAKQKALLPLTKANEWNKGVGSVIENNSRLAHFIAKTEELGSTKSAAESVKKYLFDYSDLTAFEKHVKDKAIPFYTFMRKNTPLEIEQMILNPGKFTRYTHLSQDLQEHGFMEQPDVPISSVDSVLSPLTGEGSKGNRTTSGLQRRFQGAVAPLNPLLKLGPEMASGASSYNGYPLRDTQAQAENFARNAVPPFSKVMSIPGKSALRTLLGFNDLSEAPAKGRAKGKRTAGSKSKYGPGSGA